MKIYTKFGDRGSTSLIGGAVVPKNDLRVEAYGAVDELNAVLGVAMAFADAGPLRESLSRIQKDLFIIGAGLATRGGAKAKPLPPARIEELEKEIDGLWADLPPLRNFIIPGGSRTASLLHLARTVCRRAERSIIALSQKEAINPDTVIYMNRVGDLLFTQARHVNYENKAEEAVWKGR
ncbi:cob(I)yrinic acid a,c-diamide adenosyltransferase [Candidatus Micrarchaeota archaeon]|nr:cob(I)yrinic acid a,c-diamide adenosyltransferase [Candidatus Micrarchaeota archaeon]